MLGSDERFSLYGASEANTYAKRGSGQVTNRLPAMVVYAAPP
jgi:hypothetical protein